jgi:hypothetical protein
MLLKLDLILLSMSLSGGEGFVEVRVHEAYECRSWVETQSSETRRSRQRSFMDRRLGIRPSRERKIVHLECLIPGFSSPRRVSLVLPSGSGPEYSAEFEGHVLAETAILRDRENNMIGSIEYATRDVAEDLVRLRRAPRTCARIQGDICWSF